MNEDRMTIVIGCDHAGYEYKEAVKAALQAEGHTMRDYGTDSSESVDYPDFVHPVAKAVDEGDASLGVLICGSGNGVAMTANKYSNVRAALCWASDLVSLARQHNDANILCIPARFTSVQQAEQFAKIFLSTPFEGGRHSRRVNKISSC